MGRCKACKELKRTEPFFERPMLISGRWAFHLQDTHGIPVDILPEMVEMVIRKRERDDIKQG